jgi:hypothetical protein
MEPDNTVINTTDTGFEYVISDEIWRELASFCRRGGAREAPVCCSTKRRMGFTKFTRHRANAQGVHMENLLPLLLAGAALLLGAPAQADVTLVMFRHGEKPDQGLGQLNCPGLNRALALPDVLLSKFGKPDALFAPNPGVSANDHGKPYNYVRPLATIEPTAIRTGLPVNTQWGLADLAPLEDELLSSNHTGQVLYIAWEHSLLVQIVRDILTQRGADPGVVPAWESDDFDSIYVVNMPTTGMASFRVEHEGLNGQSPLCPGQK